MTDRESTLLEGRVKQMELILGRTLAPTSVPDDPPLLEEEREYLRGEGESLYWNELEWEKLTGEERVDEEFLTELAFPGFLAFVRGLLLREVMPDSLAPAQPRPEVVESLLGFLAGRVMDLEAEASRLEGEDRDHREAELKMTSRLVDLVLYRLHDLDQADVERVEAAVTSD
jgi:hypothetical protein